MSLGKEETLAAMEISISTSGQWGQLLQPLTIIKNNQELVNGVL